MAERKIAFSERISLDRTNRLKIPPSALEARWFLLAVVSVVVPIFIIRELFFLHESRWIAILASAGWFGASLFPEIEIDLEERTVFSRVKFLRKMTVIYWKRQIPSTSRLQVHVQAYGSPRVGNCGYIHKIACVNGHKRITLRDFERSNKSHDDTVAGFAKKLAEALSIKYEGYIERPGFFW